MASSKDIKYTVDLDARAAQAELKRLARAGRDAGDDLETAFDDTASAGDKARAAITSLAQKMDADLREAAQAAEALGDALGADLAGKMDIDKVVADLNRMGVSFDEIRADADKFATTLRQVDSINVKQLDDGLGGLRTKLTDVRDSSDQSRSVLANLAGNTAQDLGELGGVVGSLGVGIGQLAEYAVDGNIAMSNLAAVAGPMAGLAAAGLLVSDTMKQIAETKAFRTEEVEKWTEAVKEGGDSIGTMRDQIEESGELLGRITQDNVLGRFLGREETVNAAVELGRFGVKLEDVLRLFEEHRGDIERGVIDWNAYEQALVDLGVPLDEASEQSSILSQALLSYSQGVADAAAETTFFQSTRASMIRALSDERQELNANEKAWEQLFEAQHDGSIIAAENVPIWNQLRETLGLTEAQMAETFNEKYLDWAATQRERTEEWEQALSDAGDAIADVRGEVVDLGDALSEALDAGDVTVDLQVDEASIRASIAETADSIQTFIDDHGAVDWSVVLDPTASAAGFDAELAGMITQIRDTFQEGIVNAFQSGGQPAAQGFMEEFLPTLTELGMTPDQASELLGLEDGTITATIQAVVDQQAAARAVEILDAIAGTGTEDVRVAAIRIDLASDNIPGEVAEVASLLVAEDLGIPVSLEDIPQDDIDAAQDYLDGNPVTMPIDTKLDKSEAERGANTFVSKKRTATVDLALVQQLVQGIVVSAFLDAVAAKQRTANINVKADNAGGVGRLIDAVAHDRTLDFYIRLPNIHEVERQLDYLARDRYATINARLNGSRPTGAAVG